MKDFNFFSPFLQKNTAGDRKKMYIAVGGLALVFVIVVSYLILFFSLTGLEKQTREIDDFLATPEAQQNRVEYDEYHSAVTLLQKYNGVLDQISANLGKSEVFGSFVLEELGRNLPPNTALESLSVNPDNSLNLVFTTDNLNTVALLAENLSDMDIFTSVILGDASQDKTEGSGYTVSVDVVLKGGPLQ